MTNGDKIRQMNDQELADYANALYLAGQGKQKYGGKGPLEPEVDYIQGLEEETNEAQ